MSSNLHRAISLFSGAGIGDIGYRAAGLDFISMAEYEADRAELASLNFPESKMFVGDICKNVNAIIQHAQMLPEIERDIFLITCTAPCQGMSKSGQGTLLKNIREGKRPMLDPRNRLIIPGLKVIKRIRPVFAVFENVCEMRNTMIENEKGELEYILDVIRRMMPREYVGEAYDVEFADYGVPQRRKRLITVYTRDPIAVKYFKRGASLVPESTHSKLSKNGKKKWVSVKDALIKFPSLDAKSVKTAQNEKIPFHRVPVLDQKKYEWIRHTPIRGSAFDNQCVNPKCGYADNQGHGSEVNHAGINQASKSTPLYCEKCNNLLPRPYAENENGSLRIMSGYTSAYKRMDPDLPAPAITRNISFPCSDHKVHPFENRVLSLAEAFVLQTLSNYRYVWGPITDRKNQLRESATDTLIRVVLGESIPPKFTELLCRYLMGLIKEETPVKIKPRQLEMFVG